MEKLPGKIITFYSYKGGTGRSMALANVAWILASNGKRVLTLDWDLEAPGLHRYFHPFMVDKELSSSDGLIDFVLKFAAAAATPETVATGNTKESITVYLAQTDSTLFKGRDAVKDVLLNSGYTVLPEEPLPQDQGEFEARVRDYLKRSTLSVHLIGESSGEVESYPFVFKQNALAVEREKEAGFSRLVWLPPEVPTVPRQLLLSDTADPGTANNILQTPLVELFNRIGDHVRKDRGDKDWYKPYANILRYASSLDWKFTGADGTQSGSLDLIPAGRQGPSYSTRVNSFNWQNFYDRLGGGALFEAAKERMRAEYDYILIDSRTGVSDTSGICTVQMPDILVVCFTLNNQSIEGAGAVAESVHAQRPDLPIFPVPTRVEKFEKKRLDRAREVAHAKFDHLLGRLKEKNQTDQYWGHVEVFYEPFYAYEEMLATFGDKPNQTNSLLASTERLTAYLTDNEVTQLVAVTETDRHIVLAKYERQAKRQEATRSASTAKEFLFYLSHSHIDDSELIEKFFSDFSHEVRVRLGASPSQEVGFLDSSSIMPGDDLSSLMITALENSRVLIALFSPAYFTSVHCGKEFQYFWERWKTSNVQRQGSSIFPIVWIPTNETLPGPAKQFVRFEPEGGLRRLMRLRSRSDEYAQLLEDIADRLIGFTRETVAPPPQPITSWSAVRNAFDEPDLFPDVAPPVNEALAVSGPRSVIFVYVAARREEIASIRTEVDGYEDDASQWLPFFPDSQKTVRILSMEPAATEHLLFSELPFNDQITMLVRQAESNNSPVILIVDAWTTKLTRYREILQSFDRYAFINCAVLIVLNEQNYETSRMRAELLTSLAKTFPYRFQATAGSLVMMRSEDEAVKKLSNSLNELRSRIINSGNVVRQLDAGDVVAKPNLSDTSQ